MRRAELIDLATIDVSSVELPVTGERLLRNKEAAGLALRLRASDARTWVLFTRKAGKATRHTLGDAALFGPDARLADVMPRFLASGKRGAGSLSRSATCGRFPITDTETLLLI